MKTPITLNVTREDMNRVTFPKGITWKTECVSQKDNTGFTYVNRSGETLEYTIPKEMRHFVYFSMSTEMRGLAEAAIILDAIKNESLKDDQMLEMPLLYMSGYEFTLLNHLNPDQITVKKARKLCKRLLRAFTNVKKLSGEDLMGATEEDWYELVFITDEAQRNVKLYNSILDNPFLGAYTGRGPDSCGFTITDGNTQHVYTLKPHLDPYDVCGGAFGDRRYALAALAAYTARREGFTGKIKACAEPYDVNSDLLKYVNDVVSGKTPAEILEYLRLSWRVQSFVVADD